MGTSLWKAPLKMSRLCFHNSKPVGRPEQSQARDAALRLIGASHVLSEAMGAPSNPASRAPKPGRGLGLGSGRRNPLCRVWRFVEDFFARPTSTYDASINHVLRILSSVRQYNGTHSLPTFTLRGACLVQCSAIRHTVTYPPRVFQKNRCISKATPLRRGGFEEDAIYLMGDPGDPGVTVSQTPPAGLTGCLPVD